MMKRIFLLMLAACCNVGSAKQPAVKPAVYSALEVRIERVLPAGQVILRMQNVGKEPLRIWMRGTEWGEARWRIVHISNGQLQTYYEDPDQIFSPNAPNFYEWPAGESKQITLDLNHDHRWWLPEPVDVKWASGDTVIAIYDVPSTFEAHKYGVWYGVTAAMAAVP